MRRFFNALVGFLELAWFELSRLTDPVKPASSPRNILVMATMGIGDLLMLSPLLQAIKKELPGSRLTLVAGKHSGEVIAGFPYVDDVIITAWEGVGFKERRRITQQLKERRFDAVFCTCTVPLRFFMRGLARIPLRIGVVRKIKFPKPWLKPFAYCAWRFNMEFIQEEFFKRFFYNRFVVTNQDPVHEIDKALKLLEVITPGKTFDRRPHFVLSSSFENQANTILSKNNSASGKLRVAVHAGSSALLKWKQWPQEKWAELIERLSKKTAASFLLLGTADEARATRPLPGTINLMGKTSLMEAAAVIKQCRLFIGGDSGLGHLALAVGTPSVRIFGPSDQPGYAVWTPGAHRDLFVDLPCRPCLVSGVLRPGVLNVSNCPHRNCLNQLSVETIYQNCIALLKESGDLK